ncbi:DUF805 domain-containing protein [Bifidobacterium oedipodis]|uniref:DUF805 domain-containing protein n=1 Tax=Bifidobacterium oedipodis TaxID=2675322 RepID=A0A7Y0ETA4_9BIFI|nr:DUF805 domain-containing protein [Bifidobacterium sp. DSM 109957]NMM94976.1 hypothetical protein [Bifidobacterium sp. DSM 109957]
MTDPNNTPDNTSATPSPDGAPTPQQPVVPPIPAVPQYGATPASAAPAYSRNAPDYGQQYGAPADQSEPAAAYGAYNQSTSGYGAAGYGDAYQAPAYNATTPGNAGNDNSNGNPFAARSANPYTQPQYGQTPQYGQPQYGQPQYDQTQYGQSQYGQQPQQPTPQFVPPQYAPNSPTGGEVPLDKPHYGCSMPEAFLRFWKKYVVFKGRASRSEYWWWILCAFIIGTVLNIITDNGDNSLGFLSTLWSLATLIPTISLAVRRLHDINKPGWWVAIFYGVAFAAGIIIAIGGGAALLGAIGAYSAAGYGYHYSSSASTAAGGIIAVVIGGLLLLATAITYIVFMAMPSKPEGARFDENYVAPGAGYGTGYGTGYGAPAAPYAPYAPSQPYPTQQAQSAQPADSPETPTTGSANNQSTDAANNNGQRPW